MSFENPTALRVGMTGTLHGWRVRIVGRLLMGVEVEGETYYWNEFNLVDASGNGGTLVFEETEDGPEWKLFTLFEPARPMSVHEAEAVRVGDTVNLDGKPIEVTLVDQSRVYHIEGTAPEGVTLGDVANYFNADAGDRMFVVSWSSEELEFYEGRDLRPEEVAQAFGISTQLHGSSAPRLHGGAATSSGNPIPKVVGVVAVLLLVFGIFTCTTSRRRPAAAPAPLAKQPAPALQLATGARGTLGQRTFTIESQVVAEIARVGRRHDRREYQLVGDSGERALLVQGLNGGTKEWHHFAPMPSPAGLGDVPPYEAAAKRKGSPVALPDRPMHVTDLFLTRAAGAPVRYGFLASGADEWLMARWTESAIEFHRGKPVTEADVAAFGTGGK